MRELTDFGAIASLVGLEELRLGSPSDAYREINADNFTRVEELLPGVEVVYD